MKERKEEVSGREEENGRGEKKREKDMEINNLLIFSVFSVNR